MANLKTDAVIATGSSTSNIDLVTLQAIIANVTTTVMRQVMTIGDPISGLNIASVVPDEPQGWEAALVTSIAYSRQMKEQNDLLMQILAELQNLATIQGGMPVTTKEIG